MDTMLELSEAPPVEEDDDEPPRRRRFGAWHAKSARRALLLTALGGLLIAGTVTALPIRSNSALTNVVPSIRWGRPTRRSRTPGTVTA